MMIQDFTDCPVQRDAGRIAGDSGGGVRVPFTAVMHPLNGRLDWDLGSLEAKVEAPSHIPGGKR